MEEKPDDIDILKVVSGAFNTSGTHSEFKMRLELAGFGEKDALDALNRTAWIEAFRSCHSLNEDFTFEKLFEKRDESAESKKPEDRDGLPRPRMFLPYFFEKTIDPETLATKVTMTAIGPGGNKYVQGTLGGLGLGDRKLEKIFGIDVTLEFFNMLAYELGAEMYGLHGSRRV